MIRIVSYPIYVELSSCSREWR